MLSSNIKEELKAYHPIFSYFFGMSYVDWDKTIPTACIEFDRESGAPLGYKINPVFFDGLNDITKKFVIIHETLHVILNHGYRSRGLDKQYNSSDINKAMDIVINHMIVNNFGIVRSQINDWEKWCWVDTVFDEPLATNLSDKLSFQTYLRYMKENETNSPENTGDHSNLPGFDIKGDVEKMVEEAIENTSGIGGEGNEEEYNSTVREAEQKFREGENNNYGVGGNFSIRIGKKLTTSVKPSQKWVEVVKTLSGRGKDKDLNWAKRHRNHTLLPRDIILPKEDVGENFGRKRKIIVYVDVSYSCKDLFEYFHSVARSIPKKWFKMQSNVFSNNVIEVDYNKHIDVIHAGTNIQAVIDDANDINQIDHVFVITDMEFDESALNNIKLPKNWSFFYPEKADINGWAKGVIAKAAALGINTYHVEDFFKKSNSST
jgi:predicted metal-dependent peptidase